MSANHGLRVGVIAILHTFNGKLEFNSHVHTMVTSGGLSESSGAWVSSVDCECERLMQAWRRAVIALLRAALQAGQFRTNMPINHVEELLIQQENRWWSIKIQAFESKMQFLRYAGRYVRRPPIRSVGSPTLGSERSRFGTTTKSCIVQFI
jgi:hypothetical protein